ncbi:LACT-domain-containing protein [Hesseltinella vesiculosa]|uniref:LACT-domain-containing protein n=1 Tax=Hesseltinella vesiculosa TaxID=101127 RepID=A0A1X2GHT9_9FUNG|nr:LACT-domain-containing protein [Hesseltinella vesiculosa]
MDQPTTSQEPEPNKQCHQGKDQKRFYYFLLGGLVALLALLAGSQTAVVQENVGDLQAYLETLPASEALDDFFAQISSYRFFQSSDMMADDQFMPALEYKDSMDLKAHYPVVMIPGIISTAIESWGTSEKSKKYFRSRLWGDWNQLRMVAMDKNGWLEHMKLDPKTGLDPENIKLRAAQGLTAADYLFTGYWVWGKVIENLAAIGYDPSNMHLASYDWRLSIPNMETRDQYFTKLKATIEAYKTSSGRKTVILSHSMGSTVFFYFMKWVEHPEGGHGGEGWVDNHIEEFVNLSGPLLGVPKAMTFLLSGETRDTMAFGSFGVAVLEKFFCRKERTDLLRTWGGACALLQKGGDAIWGTENDAPEDEQPEAQEGNATTVVKPSYGNLVSFVPVTPTSLENDDLVEPPHERSDSSPLRNQTLDMTMQLLRSSASQDFDRLLHGSYSFGLATTKEQIEKNENDPRTWSNPLESRLPHAPSMKIHCLYGVGLATERSYFYTSVANMNSTRNDTCDVYVETFNNTGGSKLMSLAIDPNVSDNILGIETGIRTTDGDNTVPVLSSGYMCTPSGGWTKHSELYNPSGVNVVTREYKNVPAGSVSIRGGPLTSDHVDILGNHDLLTDLLQIVSGHSSNVTQRIYSDIERYAQRVKL